MLLIREETRGAALVFASAVLWSLGGAIAGLLTISDSWAVVFWRSIFSATFLTAFMLWRNGWNNMKQMFATIGFAGVGVALCIATASSMFVVALKFTSVANILLIQAGVPLFAALMAYLLFHEPIKRSTWLAIAAVIVGVFIMVSGSGTSRTSALGNGLALVVAVAFASATVITRRQSKVKMLPAACLGFLFAAIGAATLAVSLRINAADAALLLLFGACTLGLGMVLWVTGVPLINTALAALLGTTETVLGPIWMWLMHGQMPAARTLIGGSVVFLALLTHLTWEACTQKHLLGDSASRPASTL